MRSKAFRVCESTRGLCRRCLPGGFPVVANRDREFATIASVSL
ncbi:hypothetical protein AZ78_2505 [Lysobacter capsici AZ78]|uniref:Uncharacterized protein n=1 Tax=Lysobacter capsici AZ78 TaxID=1444315 RepID=A0A120AGQ5_9GAMM|nr:hypothetical protein AZ78_2505 [Lysobacter capsici AZ78]